MGTLILQDGTVYQGNSFGAIGGYEGEVVFVTASSGYQEIITDSAYAKQILVMAYPEIGNCGINDFDFESEEPSLVGLVVKNNCKTESHYKSRESLSSFLKKKNVIALEDIDTRSLIQKLRDFGAMNGFITSNMVDSDFIREKINQLQTFRIKEDVLLEVSCKNRYIYNPQGKINIALMDYGVKKSLLTSLAKRDCKVTVYPCDTEAKEILENDYDALFLSGGPGNPEDFTFQLAQIRQMMGRIPMFGVSLGFQLLAIAAGAQAYRLKCGHRGGSYPIINVENNKVYMSAQNHTWTIDAVNLPRIMRPTYKNLNDDSLEGFEISSLSIYALQFYPEAKAGSCDMQFIFDEWINIIEKDINRINEVKNAR